MIYSRRMSIRVLNTKLYPPPVSQALVGRSELVKRLAQGLKTPITIVAAPPGFGKTTLLAAWIAATKNTKVTWYSLDEDDNDTARFFIETGTIPDIAKTIFGH